MLEDLLARANSGQILNIQMIAEFSGFGLMHTFAGPASVEERIFQLDRIKHALHRDADDAVAHEPGRDLAYGEQTATTLSVVSGDVAPEDES